MITEPTMDNVLLNNLRQFVHDINMRLSANAYVKTSEGDLYAQTEYNKLCRVFNLRIQEKPWVIVYCAQPKDVQETYQTAIANDLPVRIRAGGHDHEGECTGTNTILIDVSRMNWVDVDHNSLMARIGPGNIFKKLTTDLAKEEVMIPHGTCATVGISGFTMGGGWGPWTRKYGMACERLMGADLILGDGSAISVDATDNDDVPDLLWALRGGGGMSYGLVTEFRFQAFELPPELVRFKVTWNRYPAKWRDYPEKEIPTIKVLKAWEKAIESRETSQFIGTNLMINAHPAPEDQPFDKDNMYHNCVMFGYWEGNEKDLTQFVIDWFGDTIDDLDEQLDINHHHGGSSSLEAYGDLMSDWARESFSEIVNEIREKDPELMMDFGFDTLNEGKPLPPDFDDPAPHKITCRLADEQGLGEDGYEAFLRSLTSPLIQRGNRKLGLFTYVTLGAITGDYYHNHPEGSNSAFPYKDKLYTIQYQTWWNEQLENKELGQENKVYNNTNRALDWMEVARDFDIPNTSGSFISFKDSSIPTETYFAQSYDRLKQIKKDHSKDPFNHLRTRKTIY